MKKEPSRQREEGTKVFETKTDDDKINAARIITHDKQYAKVDGIMIDLFTASAICRVYEGLNTENQKAFIKMPINKMGIVALKLLK